MSDPPANPPAGLPAARGFHLPLLWLLFFGSGCAALIYEIVWLQLLQLVIGSTAVSLGVLLGTFMGGMCLGSIALPRLVSSRHHPMRVYALLESGIGILGITLLFALPHFAQIYAASVGHGLPGILWRGVVCAVCLVPPTVLMGATLPAISRWVETTPQGVSWLGMFYGGNIAGAVAGCLLAGFYLLRVHDMATASYVAAAINGVVALAGFGLAARTGFKSQVLPQDVKKSGIRPNAPGSRRVYVAIALSGMCALGAEVIWTRQLSLMLGATVYTFSIILAVFLTGLGVGSGAGAMLARTVARPRVALGICQLLLTAAIAWSAAMLARSLPYWPIDPSLSWNPWYNFQLDLARCLWAILPATVLWGASFPLALAAAASPGQDPGRWVGRIYAANTAGAIIGAVTCSILLIGWVGTQQTQRLLIVLSAAAAAVMLAPLIRPSPANAGSGKPGPRAAGAILLLAAMAVAAALVWSVPKVPWELVAHGRYLPTKGDVGKLLYMGEGMNASVAVTRTSGGAINFHVSGKVEASTEPRDMRLQRMLGHIPALLHPKPRSVLVVGCGAGVTAGSFVPYPDVERIVICEIEPLIPKVVARFFGEENYNVVTNRRVQIVYDDARHYVLTTREKFDIITSDPIHPWVKGAATLYTREYFELLKEHLNPGGLVTQWVPLYESNERVVKSEIATFFDVFPNGTIWSNDDNGEGYDIVLLGQASEMKINVAEMDGRLRSADHATVRESLEDVGFKSTLGLLATYAGQGPDLRPWLEHAEINRDGNLRLQYLAGMGLNLFEAGPIYNDMLLYRKYPGNLFVASDELEQSLKEAIKPPKSDK